MKNLFLILFSILALKSNLAFAQAEGYKLVSVRNQVFMEIPENWKVLNAQEIEELKKDNKNNPLMKDLYFFTFDPNRHAEIPIYFHPLEKSKFFPIESMGLKSILDFLADDSGECRKKYTHLLMCDTSVKSIGEYLVVVMSSKFYQENINRVLKRRHYLINLKSKEELMIDFKYFPENAEAVQQIDHIQKSIFIK